MAPNKQTNVEKRKCGGSPSAFEICNVVENFPLIPSRVAGKEEQRNGELCTSEKKTRSPDDGKHWRSSSSGGACANAEDRVSVYSRSQHFSSDSPPPTSPPPLSRTGLPFPLSSITLPCSLPQITSEVKKRVVVELAKKLRDVVNQKLQERHRVEESQTTTWAAPISAACTGAGHENLLHLPQEGGKKEIGRWDEEVSFHTFLPGMKRNAPHEAYPSPCTITSSSSSCLRPSSNARTFQRKLSPEEIQEKESTLNMLPLDELMKEAFPGLKETKNGYSIEGGGSGREGGFGVLSAVSREPTSIGATSVGKTLSSGGRKDPAGGGSDGGGLHCVLSGGPVHFPVNLRETPLDALVGAVLPDGPSPSLGALSASASSLSVAALSRHLSSLPLLPPPAAVAVTSSGGGVKDARKRDLTSVLFADSNQGSLLPPYSAQGGATTIDHASGSYGKPRCESKNVRDDAGIFRALNHGKASAPHLKRSSVGGEGREAEPDKGAQLASGEIPVRCHTPPPSSASSFALVSSSPMVVHTIQLNEEEERKAAAEAARRLGCAPSSKTIIARMLRDEKREWEEREKDSIGLVRVQRLKPNPKFNRGVFAWLPVYQGRSGHWFGCTISKLGEKERAITARHRMIVDGPIKQWLGSFLTATTRRRTRADDDDANEEPGDPPFRDRSGGRDSSGSGEHWDRFINVMEGGNSNSGGGPSGNGGAGSERAQGVEEASSHATEDRKKPFFTVVGLFAADDSKGRRRRVDTAGQGTAMKNGEEGAEMPTTSSGRYSPSWNQGVQVDESKTTNPPYKTSSPHDAASREKQSAPFSVFRLVRADPSHFSQKAATEWADEDLYLEDRATRNKKHSRFMLSNFTRKGFGGSETFNDLITSLSVIVEAKYGKDLTVEEKEEAKKRLAQVRERMRRDAALSNAHAKVKKIQKRLLRQVEGDGGGEETTAVGGQRWSSSAPSCSNNTRGGEKHASRKNCRVEAGRGKRKGKGNPSSAASGIEWGGSTPTHPVHRHATSGEEEAEEKGKGLPYKLAPSLLESFSPFRPQARSQRVAELVSPVVGSQEEGKERMMRKKGQRHTLSQRARSPGSIRAEEGEEKGDENSGGKRGTGGSRGKGSKIGQKHSSGILASPVGKSGASILMKSSPSLLSGSSFGSQSHHRPGEYAKEASGGGGGMREYSLSFLLKEDRMSSPPLFFSDSFHGQSDRMHSGSGTRGKGEHDGRDKIQWRSGKGMGLQRWEEEQVELLLASFPESKKPIETRREAKAVLHHLDQLGISSLSFSASGSRSNLISPILSGHGGGRAKVGFAEGSEMSSIHSDSAVLEPPVGFTVDEGILAARFKKEAEKENPTFMRELQTLRKQVEKRRKALNNFHYDIQYLSFGNEEMTGDEYAAEILRDVNEAARHFNLALHELTLREDVEEEASQCGGKTHMDLMSFSGSSPTAFPANQSSYRPTNASSSAPSNEKGASRGNLENAAENGEGRGWQDDDSRQVTAGDGKGGKELSRLTRVCHSFLDHFREGRGRKEKRSVACQVTEEELGVVDETLKLATEQLEDLLYHERALMDAIRFATIAVANVMSFHASLELESTCKQCFFLLDQPRTLWPCGHTFCQQCLVHMCNERDEIICAECGSICEVGYTPNYAVELIAHYQVVQEAVDDLKFRPKKTTIEGVLKNLLNDLLASQKKVPQYLLSGNNENEA